MALNGTITGKSDNSSYTLSCEWSATQSIADNTSTITANVYLKAPSGWSTVSSYWSCLINGTQVTTNKSATVSSTKVLLGTRTWTVTHASDGSCSTTISFSYSNGLASAGTYTTKAGSGSATITLNTIPRVSTFVLSNSSLNMDKNQTVTISKANSSFTHTVAYTFGNSTTTVATKTTATSISFTPPVSLASQVPNATSGTCTVKVTTYNGSTAIGDTSKTFSLVVPSTVKPSVLITSTYNDTLGGLSIAGKTTVTVKPTGTGAYGSTIKSYSYSGAGLSGTGSSKTTGTLGSGTHTITVTATDSRGRTGTGTINLTVYPYSAPTLSASVYRCDSNGDKNAMGTYAAVKLTYAISNPNNANTNAKQYKIETKKTSESTFNTLKNWADLSDGYTSTTNSVLILGDGWATTSSYDIKVSIKDNYNTVVVTKRLSTISAVLNIESDGVGVGKLHEQGKLDVAGAVYTTGGRYYATDNGKSASFGSGANDVFLHNSSSGKYLQLKDDGGLTYSGSIIYHSGNSSTLNPTFAGATINGLVKVNESVISQRSGYQLRLRPAAEGDATYTMYETSAGTRKGFVGTPNANYNMHILSDTGMVVLRGSYISCRNASDNAYAEIRSSAFTVNSEAKWKQNISVLDKSAMDLIRQTVVYEYELKDDQNTRNTGKKTVGLVIDYGTPEEIISEVEVLDDKECDEGEEFVPGKVKQIDKGVDLYAMSSLAWKALQEKDTEIKDLQTRVEHLETLIKQLLEAK